MQAIKACQGEKVFRENQVHQCTHSLGPDLICGAQLPATLRQHTRGTSCVEHRKHT
jgi:hypothetical protein